MTVHLIGLCEYFSDCWIVLTVVKPRIELTTVALQQSPGQVAGIKAAIHAIRSTFEQDNTDAALLVDTKNALNSLNW